MVLCLVLTVKKQGVTGQVWICCCILTIVLSGFMVIFLIPPSRMIRCDIYLLQLGFHPVTESATTVFELLMMSGLSPETCWAIKKHWNNKFYYTVTSCWFFLWYIYIYIKAKNTWDLCVYIYIYIMCFAFYFVCSMICIISPYVIYSNIRKEKQNTYHRTHKIGRETHKTKIKHNNNSNRLKHNKGWRT